MGIVDWLLTWLIVNALFVAWRALVASKRMEVEERCHRESARPSGFSRTVRRRLEP